MLFNGYILHVDELFSSGTYVKSINQYIAFPLLIVVFNHNTLKVRYIHSNIKDR